MSSSLLIPGVIKYSAAFSIAQNSVESIICFSIPKAVQGIRFKIKTKIRNRPIYSTFSLKSEID